MGYGDFNRTQKWSCKCYSCWNASKVIIYKSEKQGSMSGADRTSSCHHFHTQVSFSKSKAASILNKYSLYPQIYFSYKSYIISYNAIQYKGKVFPVHDMDAQG